MSCVLMIVTSVSFQEDNTSQHSSPSSDYCGLSATFPGPSPELGSGETDASFRAKY